MICDYDIALHRLKCYCNDVYYGITPSINTVYYNCGPPVFACRFCTTPGYEEILALANEDGKVAFQDTKIKNKKYLYRSLEGTQAHCNAIFDIAWMPKEMKLVTVSGDHTARLWDVTRPEIKQIKCFHAHTRSVKTAVFRDDDRAVFATGARDGFIMIWDIRANHSDEPKPDNCIANAHSYGGISNTRRKSHTPASRAHSITGLVFQDDFTLISCAAGDGLLKVWDLRKNYTVHKKEPIAKHLMNYSGNSTRNGFSSLLICPARITLYASCMDNVIYAYNISSYNRKPVAEYHGHQNHTYYVKTCLSSDGRYLASGSSDELAYIWNTNRPGAPLIKLSGHRDEVTCIAWCSTGETKIVTCSDDAYHKIWRVGPEHEEDNKEVTISGQAEVVERYFLEKMKLETTPSSRHSNTCQETTPSSDEHKASIFTPVTTPESSKEDYNGNKHNSVKRSYLQMMMGSRSEGKFKCILSPIHENHEMVAKRVHMDNRGMRRLFSSSNEIPSTSRDNNSDEPSTSQSTSTNEASFSPTLNLPNFVIDGTAPHLLEISPQKYKENVDWLTKIRKERYEQKKTASVSSSPKTQLTPSRRSNRSRSTEPQKITKTTKSISLLNFFKAISKDNEKDLSSNKNNLQPT
ncbi:Protein lethal(2)denticleless [Trachymyrmex septentrionalis]|uniref:Protein lethal(2)denticleless n=2 Tax=Trachymyrmex septentrionalis TaxID=34720 RepID=A0A195FJM3_9HYME|nr:PREDICTED: protein lethal(2)denticleless isoform X2 [Trachymyrmex septentrionalis]KYN40566.1 Protein lethal(2)denticleless [Trachymyrmex septentrionalis]